MIDLRLYVPTQRLVYLVRWGIPKLPNAKWYWPAAVERIYLSKLLTLAGRLKAETELLLIPRLPALFREAEINRPKADAWPDSVQQLIQSLSISLDQPFNEAEAMALQIGQQGSKWNNVKWQETLVRVFGVNLFQMEPWLYPQLQAFAKTNAGLIKSMKTQYISSIEQATMKALQSGQRWETFAKTIQAGEFTDKYVDKAKFQAKLVARDQIGKLNGDLTRMRQQDIGVKSYIWRTMKDERVRDSHRSLDGKEFDYAGRNRPPNGEDPGQAVNCRCNQEASFIPLVYSMAA
jgi:SPP1 gp7 family putative phage head morphogenesis protein